MKLPIFFKTKISISNIHISNFQDTSVSLQIQHTIFTLIRTIKFSNTPIHLEFLSPKISPTHLRHSNFQDGPQLSSSSASSPQSFLPLRQCSTILRTTFRPVKSMSSRCQRNGPSRARALRRPCMIYKRLSLPPSLYTSQLSRLYTPRRWTSRR